MVNQNLHKRNTKIILKTTFVNYFFGEKAFEICKRIHYDLNVQASKQIELFGDGILSENFKTSTRKVATKLIFKVVFYYLTAGYGNVGGGCVNATIFFDAATADTTS